MAMLTKSKVHTVIFSILIVLGNWTAASAQQQQLQQTKVTDQNFYFQSPQRFQSAFPASRNGFYPSNVLPNLAQNLPQSLPRSQLGGAIQQAPPQQQDQSVYYGGIPPKNDATSSDFFQYSAFPQQAHRQQENFIQISPRPFAVQPNGNHGVQFVRPPIVQQPQQYSTDQTNNHFQFPQHIPQQRPQLVHNPDSLDHHQQPALQQQQPIAQSAPVSRAPTLTVYDAAKFVKQGQANQLRQLNDSSSNRNSNNNSIRNSVRKSNEFTTSQESNNSNENSRFPSTRNRFHPFSTSKPTASSRAPPQTTPAPVATTTQADDLSSADQRQNRIPISTRFGTSREQNTSVRINKFLRQPVYTSRESNQTPKRINVTHNGSSNREEPTASQEVTNRTHQLQLLQQARQKIRESSVETVKTPTNQVASKAPQKPIENQPSVETADDEEEYFYDDEMDTKSQEKQGQGDDNTETKVEEKNKPVILTSNFFLPGKLIPNFQKQENENQEPNDLSSDIEANEQEKDHAEDVIDAQPENETERIVEKSTKKFEEPVTKASTTTKVKPVTESVANVDYVYEYEDYADEPTTEVKDQSKSTDNEKLADEEMTTAQLPEQQQPTDEIQEPITVKSVAKSETKSVKTSMSTSTTTSSSSNMSVNTSSEQIEASIEPVETSSVSTTEATENTIDSTEGYVVVASVQTSRSISGARFLTFPQVEQDEKKQALNDARKEGEDYSNENGDDPLKYDDFVTPTNKETDVTDVESIETSGESEAHLEDETETTNSDVVKTKVNKLSTFSEKFAHLHELNEPKPEFTTKSIPVMIRKFAPRTTKAPARKVTTTSRKPNFDVDDELASLLPPGYKFRPSSLATSTTTPKTTTTSTTVSSVKNEPKVAPKIDVFLKDAIHIDGKNIQFKEIALDSLLPKDYKPPSELKTPTEHKPKAINLTKISSDSDLLSKFKFEDNIEALLPKDFKLSAPSTTKAPLRLSTVTEDISKFLPPGFKLPKESFTTKRPMPKTTMDDISKFLPHGYKLPKSTTTEKPETTPNAGSSLETVLNKLSFNTDIGNLLPPGYKQNESNNESASKEKAEPNDKPVTNGTSSNSTFKLVFPKGIGKRPSVRSTTPKPSHAEGPTQPGITIRKGLPIRVTTVFTGWPTVSTTPLSIEKLLQQQGVQSIDISEILGRTSSSTSTTVVTTTTTTTTVRPTQPGLCHGDCDLAGTIKIVDGVKWKPELLDHNTIEWKTLAKQIETQLNEVYSKANRLKKWYKKIRIDSFSQGSVLVDYFVELADVSRDINTQEIKQMFHSALTEVPMTVVPLKNNATASSNVEQIKSDIPDNAKPARSNYLMGDFILDPLATDFIVIPKQRVVPTTQNEIEQNSIIPQWAIAVIVIGAGSLLFVVIFGAAVIMNRQKRSKKKAPVPLTADMLNELNKNHMGGFENYGNEELYIEDTWDDVKPDFKPKRFANSSSDRDERFDSWRTQQKYQANADYYYDQNMTKPHYSQKSYAYPPQTDPYMDNFQPHYHPSYSTHHHPSQQNAMGLYTYNSRRYNRDYDPDF